ncbi:MAG: tetratricopeptide repeat protein [Bacteroidota bacterium]
MSKKKKNKGNTPVIARTQSEDKRTKQSHSSGGLLRSVRNDSNFRWAYIFLFVFAVILYANTLNHNFAFDDSVVITGNKYTKQGFDGIKTLAAKDLFYGIYGNALDLEGGRWRPLTLVMFAVEYHFFGDNAMPYHFINIFLYGITAIILLITLKEFFPRNHLLAFITTLLFIAHPIHTEVVANIKSRDEIVSFLFLCLMFLFLFRFVITEKRKFIFYSILCYFTALLSKENGITFIAIIPLALFCFAGKNIRQSLMLTIPFLITAGIYLAIRTSLVGMIGDRESNDVTDNPFLQLNFPALPTPLPFVEKFATICWILLKYLLLLIFPHPLTSDYGFNEIPAISLSDPKAIASLLIYGGLFSYAIKIVWNKARRTGDEGINLPSIFSFSILYFLITISIVSNLFFLIGTTMGERFAYISSLGFCIALASILLRITNTSNCELKKDFYKNLKLAIPLLLIIVSYSYKTFTRNPAWKDNKILFTTDVKTSVHSANAHYYYANTMFTDHINDEQSPTRDSLFTEAKKEFHKAMEINPYFHYCYYNIGLIWEKLSQPDSAIAWQTKAINLKPENSMAQYMAKGALGLVYGKLKGDADKAIPLLKEALANKPDDTGYHENLGICYAMKGDYDNSIKEFETSLKLKTEIKKEDTRIFMNLGLSWQNKGDKQKADEYFQKAFQLDPSLKK